MHIYRRLIGNCSEKKCKNSHSFAFFLAECVTNFLRLDAVGQHTVDPLVSAPCFQLRANDWWGAAGKNRVNWTGPDLWKLLHSIRCEQQSILSFWLRYKFTRVLRGQANLNWSRCKTTWSQSPISLIWKQRNTFLHPSRLYICRHLKLFSI